VLLGVFVHTETRAVEPILPLRLFASSTRTTANLARGLVYVGMYGMFFFLAQFLQDVQGYSPLRAGVAFLPVPASVFLSSQLTSRVLVRRMAPKTLMMAGASLVAVSLALAAQITAASSYAQILASLVLLGMGSGISFVSLTSVSLADVEPADAGAASGLVNVSQQLGAALGLAVLVTAFSVVTDHRQLGAASTHAPGALVHGLDDVLGIGALFALAALALIAVVIPQPARSGLAGGADDEAWLEECDVAEAG